MKIQAAFHAPDNKAHIYKTNAINEDIRDYLEKIFPRNVKACKQVEKIFKGKNELETAHLIWQFLKTRCHYRRDPNQNQIIREVSYFVNRGNLTGDCKTFATFGRAVYAAIYPELETAFQYAGYLPDAVKPSHVYTVVKDRNGNKIIIDGCYTKFNSEKNYTLALTPKYRTMQVTSLSGNSSAEEILKRINNVADGNKRDKIKRLARCRNDLKRAHIEFEAGVIKKPELRRVISNIQMEMNGIGKLTPEQRKAKRKKMIEKGKKFWSKLGKGFLFINLLPIRAAFNAITAMNVNAIAHNLRYLKNNADNKDAKLNTGKEWKKVLKVWSNVGGLKKALLKAIELGAKHKPLFIGKKAKARFNERKKANKGFAGMYDNLDGIYIGDLDGIGFPPAAAAAVAAAGGIIAAIIPAILQGLKKGGKGAEAAQVAEQGQEIVNDSRGGGANFARAAEEATEEEGLEDDLSGIENDGINQDWSALTTALSSVAKVGIEAGAQAIAKKAKKKPKLKKFLDTANEATEDYGTGMYLRKSGYTSTAKQFKTAGMKYLPYAAGLVALIGAAFIFKKK